MNQTELRHRIRANTHQDEHQAVTQLLHSNPMSNKAREQILNDARSLVTDCRRDKNSSGTLDAFLLEFGLSNAEGVALMCLAEALLRVPDALTADRLIAEKIRGGNWGAHSGKSESLFVNASTWGLMLTGQLVSLDAEITQHTDSWLKRLTATLGEPVIRTAVMQAMKIMGGQYVLGPHHWRRPQARRQTKRPEHQILLRYARRRRPHRPRCPGIFARLQQSHR